MIVIYTQEKTYIRQDAAAALPVLKKVYGEILGKEAYRTVNKARIGMSYQKNGGPLVKVVSETDAMWIKEKETEIGML